MKAFSPAAPFRSRIALGGWAVALAALVGACSPKSDSTQPPAASPPELGQRQPAGSPPELAPTRPPVELTAAPTAPAAPPPLLVTAILDAGGRVQAGLRHLGNDQAALVREGGNFAGYTVSQIDADQQSVTLVKGDEKHVVYLNNAIDSEVGYEPMSVAPATPPPAAEMQWATSNLPAMGKATTYKPTEDEKTRGIDPNNSSTWPDDYRGPGIERAMRGLPVDP